MDEDELFVTLYDELRSLARARLARLPRGNTLQPTALVHEAYLRLQDAGPTPWDGKAHYFGAAAQAMRRILVDQARRKCAVKRGGDRQREDGEDLDRLLVQPAEQILAVHEALQELEQRDATLALIVQLRYFAGLDIDEVASTLDMPRRTLQRRWRFAAAHLRRLLSDDSDDRPAAGG